MSEEVVVISIALAFINVVSLWFVKQNFVGKTIKKIVIVTLLIFNVLDIITITNRLM